MSTITPKQDINQAILPPHGSQLLALWIKKDEDEVDTDFDSASEDEANYQQQNEDIGAHRVDTYGQRPVRNDGRDFGKSRISLGYAPSYYGADLKGSNRTDYSEFSASGALEPRIKVQQTRYSESQSYGGRKVTLSWIGPKSDRQTKEDRLSEDLHIYRRELITTSSEPEWTSSLSLNNYLVSPNSANLVIPNDATASQPKIHTTPNFISWTSLVEYSISPEGDIVREMAAKTQERLDNVKVGLTVLGNGGNVEGVFGVIYEVFSKRDWLSLYRAEERKVMAANSEAGNQKIPDQAAENRRIRNLESELFSIDRFDGYCEDLLVITYPKTGPGTIDLYKYSITSTSENLPNSSPPIIDHVAHTSNVPKPVLKTLAELVTGNNKIVLVKQGEHVRSTGPGEYSAQTANISTHQSESTKTQSTSSWKVGDGWRKALNLSNETGKSDGLLASIPELFALLHLNKSNLTNCISSPPYTLDVFSPSSAASSQSAAVGSSKQSVRCVKILEGPQGTSHSSSTQRKVVVVYPSDGAWAKEKILWA